MDIVIKDVNVLLNDQTNARVHPDRNIEIISGSLHRFGQQKPIVIDESGQVIAGNGTLTAAKMLGWDTIECVVSQLTDQEIRAYTIADNRSTDTSHYDDFVLIEQLQAFEDSELVVAAGYTAEEIEALINAADDDEAGDIDGETFEDDKFRVTVVFDDESQADSLAQRLKNEGYKVKVH